MKFTIEEILIIKDALTIALDYSGDLEDVEGTINLLDRIDEELDLD